MDLSQSCTQSIKFGCDLAPLEDDDVDYGTWINRNGEKEIYFVGSNSGTHMCSCALTNTCADPAYNCNCDAQFHDMFHDLGTITDMSALPITGFNYYGLQRDDELVSFCFINNIIYAMLLKLPLCRPTFRMVL